MNYNVYAIYRTLRYIFVAQIIDDLILQIWMLCPGKTAYVVS